MRYSTAALVAVAGCFLFGFGTTASAGQWDIVLNGKSFHLDADEDWNESNWGLGFEHEFNPGSRWVRLALGNGFRDSDDEMSWMAGGGIKRRFRLPFGERRVHMDLGAVGFVMTRDDVNGSQPFPGILPAFSVGTQQFSVNMTYLPGHIADRLTKARKSDPELDGILFMQFKLNLRLFGFGSRQGSVLAAN